MYEKYINQMRSILGSYTCFRMDSQIHIGYRSK
jgi:hypothetical protein